MAQKVPAAAVASLPTNYHDAVVGGAVADGGSAAGESASSPPTRPSPLTPWAGGSDGRAAKRWRPASAFTTPVFVVKEKGVECKLCDTMIGYNVRKHVVECKTHQARLDSAPAFPNAVSLEEAEQLLAPRTSEGRKKRKKRYYTRRRESLRRRRVVAMM